MPFILKFLRDGVIVLAIAVVFVAILEFAARLYLQRDQIHLQKISKSFYHEDHLQPTDRYFYQLNRKLFWTYKPNLAIPFSESHTHRKWTFRTNAAGFRVENLDTPSNTDEEFSILSFGDSCTAGLEAAANYTNVLGQLIQESDPNKKVVIRNFAVGGYTSHQGLHSVSSEVSGTDKVSLALIHFGHNDTTAGFLGIPDKELSLVTMYRLRIRKFLQRAHLALFAHSLVLESSFASEFIPRVGPDDFKTNIRSMINELQARGARVVLINSIHAKVFREHPDSDALALGEIANDTNSLFINVADVAMKFEGHQFFNAPERGDDIHPSPLGHRRLGEYIYARITRVSN